MKRAILLFAAIFLPLAAQDIKFPANLEKLAARAEESVDVTLSGSMLRLAARFISDRDADAANVRKLIGGLDGIYVRSFSFARDGEYNMADVDALRAQVQPPNWSRIVGVTSKRTGDDVDVFFKVGAGDKLGGIVIIAAEPRQLTFVNISGTIDPDQLPELSGEFHIPRIQINGSVHGRRGAR
jgi:Domain of unknown function (DUF4252)